MYLGLSNLGLSSLGSSQTISSQLFANGEQGAWYDPSDINTMFQDSAGTTPGAVGQPVGLILDKRLGLAPGPELISDPSFDNPGSWTPSSSAVVVAGGAAVFTAAGFGVGVHAGAVTQTGKTYEAVIVVDSASGNLSVAMAQGSAPTAALHVGTNTVILSATGGSVFTPTIFSSAASLNAVVSSFSVRELPGNHVTQATATSRPTLQQDASGFYYLNFDGVDDSLATASIDFSGTDKMTAWTGVNKQSDAAAGILTEFGINANTTAGSFALFTPLSASSSFDLRYSGVTPFQDIAVTGYAAPISAVVTVTIDLAAAGAVARVNGTAAGSNASTAGGGKFGNQPLYIGSRQSASLRLNGRIYSLIVRGATSNATQIAFAERFVGSKMGIAL